MRLIDADKINFSKIFIGASDFAKDMRSGAKELIEKQPTAFDLESAIAELDKRRNNKYHEDGSLLSTNVFIKIDDVIEILNSAANGKIGG